MKKTLLLILFLFSLISAKTQDTLVLTNGKSLIVKILGISDSMIDYKFYNNQEGKLIKMPIKYVDKIIYENGIVHTFDPTKNTKATTFDRTKRFGTDLLSLGVPLSASSLYYERLYMDGIFGFNFPLTIYTDAIGFYGYTVGAAFKYYPAGMGRWFFVGPFVNFGQFFNPDPFLIMYFGPKLGVQIQISPLFALTLSAEIGTVTDFQGVNAMASLNFGMNFTF